MQCWLAHVLQSRQSSEVHPSVNWKYTNYAPDWNYSKVEIHELGLHIHYIYVQYVHDFRTHKLEMHELKIHELKIIDLQIHEQ